MINSSLVLSIVTFVYGFSAVLYISAWIFGKESPARIARVTAIAAMAGNLAGFLLRWSESYGHGYGHIPLSNLYESLVFFALAIALISVGIELRYRNPMITTFAMPLAFIALAYASLSPAISDKIQPLIPALKSNWLTAHVVTCFLGYAGFATAFGIGVMYLVREAMPVREGGLISRLPEGYILDELIQKTVMFGFLFLTVGIITGAVWANSAWGSYWSWDPKETWSLITWFVYAIMLHLRFMRGWSGARIAVISIIGFMAVMFTYFGVNFLPGLHSYGSM